MYRYRVPVDMKIYCGYIDVSRDISTGVQVDCRSIYTVKKNKERLSVRSVCVCVCVWCLRDVCLVGYHS